MNYDFKATEQKWQAKWEEAKVFEAQDNSDKPKFYELRDGNFSTPSCALSNAAVSLHPTM